jgi:hypothetical protein
VQVWSLHRIRAASPCLAEEFWVNPVPIKNGMITAPERPGHGLAFKPEILRDFAVKE